MLKTRVYEDNSRLYIEWENNEDEICLGEIDYTKMVYLRKSRRKYKQVKPVHCSFDFGKVKIRFWQTSDNEDQEHFAMKFFQGLTKALPRYENNNQEFREVKRALYLNTLNLSHADFMRSLNETIERIKELSNGNEDATVIENLYQQFTTIVRLLNLQKKLSFPSSSS